MRISRAKPIPQHKNYQKIAATLRRMEIGDSMLLSEGACYRTAHEAARRQGKKVQTKMEKGRYRAWRIS